jgi:hypothetical protein
MIAVLVFVPHLVPFLLIILDVRLYRDVRSVPTLLPVLEPGYNND